MFIQEFYADMHAIDTFVPQFTTIHDTCIVVTLDFTSELLHVTRVDLPDYPSYRHLSSISRDELASLFYKKAML